MQNVSSKTSPDSVTATPLSSGQIENEIEWLESNGRKLHYLELFLDAIDRPENSSFSKN